jgi:hypothetical protein
VTVYYGCDRVYDYFTNPYDIVEEEVPLESLPPIQGATTKITIYIVSFHGILKYIYLVLAFIWFT